MRTPTPSEVIRPVSIAGSCTGMARRCHDGQVDHAGGISLAQMLAVLDAVRAVGCRFWIEGGWGIDALVGHQTRPHRDVDIEIDGAFEEEVLAALRDLGYVIETDWRPNRVELTAPGRGWVDVHPLVIDDDGNARQAALGGGWHEFPRSFFTMGHLGDVAVPCFSKEAQRLPKTPSAVLGVGTTSGEPRRTCGLSLLWSVVGSAG